MPPWAPGSLRGEATLCNSPQASFLGRHMPIPLCPFPPCETFTFFIRTPSESEVFYHPPPRLPRPLKPLPSFHRRLRCTFFCGTWVPPNFPANQFGRIMQLSIWTILCAIHLFSNCHQIIPPLLMSFFKKWYIWERIFILAEIVEVACLLHIFTIICL